VAVARRDDRLQVTVDEAFLVDVLEAQNDLLGHLADLEPILSHQKHMRADRMNCT
jgi:hypothetical protein